MIIKRLNLTYFRGFGSFVLDGLKPFTIIAGRNNVGKTSILEGLYYLAQRNMAVTPGQLVLSRQMGLARRELSSLFLNMDDNGEILIQGEFSDGSYRSVGLEKTGRNPVEMNLESEDSISMADAEQMPVYGQQSTALAADGRESHALSLLYFTKDMYKAREQELTKKGAACNRAWDDTWKCHYYQTRGLRARTKIYELLFKAKKEQVLLGCLQWMDDRVRDIVFAGEQLLVDIGVKGVRFPVEVMGDGMVKITDVLALVALANPGDVVCIDEAENGLHYSVLKTFISALAKLAQTNGVQIIMTTHSREFLEHVADEDLEPVLGPTDFFGFKNLIRNGPAEIDQVDYDYEQFAEAVRNGMEVR